MISYRTLLERTGGGQAAGKLELHSTSPEKAVAWSEKFFASHGHVLHDDIPNFEQNYSVAKMKATAGRLKRSEMPVISSRDLKGLEAELKSRGIRVTKGRMPVVNMKPLQYQIYIDKAMKWTAINGPKVTRKFLEKETFFIISNDDYIMEGHHRFLQAILFDSTLVARFMKIDLPHDQLLRFLLSYTDKIGNVRNEGVNHGTTEE